VAAQAARLGISPEERLYDLMCEDDGRAMLLQPLDFDTLFAQAMQERSPETMS